MSIGKVDVRKGMRETAENIQFPVDVQDTTDTGKEKVTSTLTDEVIAAESSARTTNGNSSDIDVSNYTHLISFLDITAVGADANETLDVDVESKDPISGNYVVIASFTQSTQPQGAQTRWINVGQGVDDGTLDGSCLGSTIRLTWTVAGTTPQFTFSLSVVLKSSS